MAGGVGEALDEGLDRGGVAVPALEIDVHAGAETLGAQQGLQHTDQLRALVVDGRGVKVLDFQIAGGPHRMGQGAGVLGELAGAKGLDLLDPLDRMAALIGGKALVAEDREALFQAQLEPVAAGDAVAGPVVEIFVGDHALDPLIVDVGGGLGVGQQQGGVEYVQPLVFHGPEIEVAHGDDHEQVQVVFAAELVLVPPHRPLERVHGVGGAFGHAGVDIEAQLHGAPGHGDDLVLQHVQVAGDQGEQVAGLGEGIVPDREMPPAVQLAGLHQVAVGQQPRVGRLVRLYPGGEAGQDVRPVGEPGDLAEALGLALGAEPAGRHVEAFEEGVGGGIDLDLGLQHEGGRDVRNGQVFRRDPLFVRRQHAPVDGHRDRLQPHPVQAQGFGVVAVAPDGQARRERGWRRAPARSRARPRRSDRPAGGIRRAGSAGGHLCACQRFKPPCARRR